MRNRIAALLIAGVAVTGAMSTAGVASAREASSGSGKPAVTSTTPAVSGKGGSNSGKTTVSSHRGRRPGNHI